MRIIYLIPSAAQLVGMIPDFLYESDPRPAAEQFDEHYAFGGGWRPMDGWKVTRELPPALHLSALHAAEMEDTKVLGIKYPGDPNLFPVALIEFREEKIWVYSHAWVAIEKADGSVEISRMD